MWVFWVPLLTVVLLSLMSDGLLCFHLISTCDVVLKKQDGSEAGFR
jgi:hypothetical protein